MATTEKKTASTRMKILASVLLACILATSSLLTASASDEISGDGSTLTGESVAPEPEEEGGLSEDVPESTAEDEDFPPEDAAGFLDAPEVDDEGEELAGAFMATKTGSEEGALRLIDSGISGGCKWEVSEEGELYIYPTSGGSGTLAAMNHSGLVPWFKHAESITSLRIAPGVIANEISNSIFSSLQITTLAGLENLDISRVTQMTGWFRGCTKLTTPDFPADFDTSHIKGMGNMFGGCTGLVSLDFPATFNLSNIENVSSMFAGCTGLTSLNFSASFITSSVTTMKSMFDGCTGITKPDFPATFTTSAVTDMNYMFQGCTSLASLDFPAAFDTSNVETMEWMFADCEALTSFNFPSTFVTPKVTSMKGMFIRCSGFTRPDFPATFTAEKVENMSSMFQGCRSLETLNFPATFDTSNVTDMGAMFHTCHALTTPDFSPTFNTSNVLNMGTMFGYSYGLKDLNFPPTFNTSNVINMSGMFDYCKALTSADLPETFKTSKVENMYVMFRYCLELESISLPESFDTSSVENMQKMFANNPKLAEINFSTTFDTSAVTDMEGMFQYCPSLSQLDLQNFDTSLVSAMDDYMFYGCDSLTKIILGPKFSFSGANGPDGERPMRLFRPKKPEASYTGNWISQNNLLEKYAGNAIPNCVADTYVAEVRTLAPIIEDAVLEDAQEGDDARIVTLTYEVKAAPSSPVAASTLWVKGPEDGDFAPAGTDSAFGPTASDKDGLEYEVSIPNFIYGTYTFKLVSNYGLGQSDPDIQEFFFKAPDFISVEVPLVLSFEVMSDGEVTLLTEDSYQVKNLGNVPVKITNINAVRENDELDVDTPWECLVEDEEEALWSGSFKNGLGDNGLLSTYFETNFIPVDGALALLWRAPNESTAAFQQLYEKLPDQEEGDASYGRVVYTVAKSE